MAKSRRGAGADAQLELVATPRTARRRGRVERAVAAAIVAGRDGGGAARPFAGVEALAREVAAALDAAAAGGQVYAVAQLSPRLLDVLRDLRLTPASAGVEVDPLTELLHELSAPAVLDPEG